jgi:hypothetical protein
MCAKRIYVLLKKSATIFIPQNGRASESVTDTRGMVYFKLVCVRMCVCVCVCSGLERCVV